jgi:hypothetical protein
MAFVVAVTITYRIDDTEEERSHAIAIEQESPPSRADIQAEVDAIAPTLVSRSGSPPPGGPPQTISYTWIVEAVYET